MDGVKLCVGDMDLVGQFSRRAYGHHDGRGDPDEGAPDPLPRQGLHDQSLRETAARTSRDRGPARTRIVRSLVSDRMATDPPFGRWAVS
jgi:hypothetical protein